MPRFKYLKPFIITKLNLMKLPSDNMTKVVDSFRTMLTFNQSQDQVAARLSRHCGIDSLKIFQAHSLKKRTYDFSFITA